jgi:hypothetical protein
VNLAFKAAHLLKKMDHVGKRMHGCFVDDSIVDLIWRKMEPIGSSKEEDQN